MHSPSYADMPATFGTLLDQPGVPRALRGLKAPPPDGITFHARQKMDAKGLFALFSDTAFVQGALTRDPFKTSRELETWLSKITPSSRFEVVAKRGETLVGFAGLYPQADHLRHVGSLMLGVTSQAQGRGIGSFLLQLMVWTGWFVEGLSKVQLTVFNDNLKAIRLYEAAGFQIEGTLRQFARSNGHSRDAYAMALFLD